MEIKNGIIIDGVLHEMTNEELQCDECSLHSICQDSSFTPTLCEQFDCTVFVSRGKVKIEKEEYNG